MFKTKAKIKLYTDGGCSPNPGLGGWAALITCEGVHNIELFGAEANTTNNRMELTAAIMGLRCILRSQELGELGCRIDVYTDSTYLRNAFEQGWLEKWKKNDWKRSGKEVLNVDLWKELVNLSMNFKINWKWVKGHDGNEFNEHCDKLVHFAREEWERLPHAEVGTGGQAGTNNEKEKKLFS